MEEADRAVTLYNLFGLPQHLAALRTLSLAAQPCHLTLEQQPVTHKIDTEVT